MQELKRHSTWLCAALGATALVAVCLTAGAAHGQLSADTEGQMKAGFIYNFALFTEWPATVFKTADAPLVMCVAGNRDTLRAFDALREKKINNRPVTVHAYGDNATGHTCHIIYIPATGKAEAAALIKRVSGPGVLTIGDAEGFAGMGGIIGFYREGNKLRFEINTDAARRAGLKLSSQLLKLAVIATDGKQ